jgi:hypothetical protein
MYFTVATSVLAFDTYNVYKLAFGMASHDGEYRVVIAKFSTFHFQEPPTTLAIHRKIFLW